MPTDEVEVSDDTLPDVSAQPTAPEPAAPPPEAAEAPQQADAWATFRQLPQFQSASDQEIATRLHESMQRETQAARALQQYQSIIPAASEYLSNRAMYEQWKHSQSSSQQPAPAAPKPEESWWNPPKVKDIYRQYLTRDQSGREVVADGAPLEAQHELAAYQSYRAEFARKFLDDPQATLGPMIERIVSDRAQEIAESQISGLKEESFVQQIEAENRDWLFDQQGHVSREGLLVQKFIEDARGLGIKGAQARWDYATAMVERELALTNLQSAQQSPIPQVQQPAAPVALQPKPQADLAQRNMEFLRQQASRTPTRRAQSTAESRAPQKPMTFSERMRANLGALAPEE